MSKQQHMHVGAGAHIALAVLRQWPTYNIHANMAYTHNANVMMLCSRPLMSYTVTCKAT